ncbi:MAG: zinc ribbon domain-containing protein [Anaerolineales bacterium]
MTQSVAPQYPQGYNVLRPGQKPNGRRSITSSLSSTLLIVVLALSAAFLVALWASLILWTVRDIQARTHDRLVVILAGILVGVLNLAGLLIYLLLRPSHTLVEAYQETLEEEALLQGLTDRATCPGCSRQVRDAWQVCPSCGTRLRKACPSCQRLSDLTWTICPYCATSLTGGAPREAP